MSVINVFKIIPQSFYSKTLYRKAAHEWDSQPFLYLLLLLALCAMIPAVVVIPSLPKLKTYVAAQIIPQIPQINITNGQISTIPTGRTVIKLTDHGKVTNLMVIDTEATGLSFDNTDAEMIMTKNQILRKRKDIVQPPIDLSQVKSFHLDQVKASQWLDDGILFMSIIIYPLILLGYYIYRVIQILFYALIGLVFNAIFKANLVYSKLINVAFVAIVPAIIIDTALDLLGFLHVHLIISGWIFFLISIGYLGFGVWANRPQTPPLPEIVHS